MDGYPEWYLRRMLLLAVYKGEGDRVREWMVAGADPNWYTKRGTPMLIRGVRGPIVEFEVVKALLDNGADPALTDVVGFTALSYARRRLQKFEGRPRKPPRRSNSLTAGGELILHDFEWEHLEKTREEHPEFVEMYLEERRRAAERTFDTRGNLERIVPVLEKVTPGG